MFSCECHGLQHYALGLNLCVSLVVHLGTLHINGLDRSQFPSQFPCVYSAFEFRYNCIV